ncbi:hypothetical protein AB1Y20_022205 [Prymnesium parvum]|uniref:CRAL-TRIO domain-containing protein n=1 Tax=Prymnesium parvum TaxID=97485 RepID=A0AB34JGN9_PRYPA|mmetsp:Transcript_43372/g.107925  ORF Transcript_43372/g.107925 Transcript_43372/m.107925 type:complete len:279 (+) Transcript_43372:22-858(+)
MGGVQWADPRFAPAVDSVRAACNVSHRDDDAIIGMMLDRFGWDQQKVVEMYQQSVARRAQMGMNAIREDIQTNGLTLEQFPHHHEVGRVIPIFASTSLERPAVSAGAEKSVVVDGKTVVAGDVIGCYEMRYGQGESTDQTTVTPQQFTKYMLYVTQWRWLQCEAYIQRHGRLGFWSMIHDLSCPYSFFTLWGRARSIFTSYMNPVEESCAGLFPPMVQKILIINVPSLFGPIWSVISPFLPQHHKDRIVLLTTSNSTEAEVSKYMPSEHMPPHLKPQK